VSDVVVRWGDFGAGHRGLLDPARSSNRSFGGYNIQQYTSGMVGPRSGPFQLDLQSVIGMDYTGISPAVGGPWGFDVFDNYIYIFSNWLHRFDLNQLVSSGYAVAQPFTNAGAANGNPNGHVPMVRLASTLYLVWKTSLYKYDLSAMTGAVQAPGFTPKAGLFNFWQNQLFAVDNTQQNRLRFTGFDTAANVPLYDTWPANYYIDIGSPQAITAIVPFYNQLYIAKRNSWWVITGVPGIDYTLRQAALGYGPIFQGYCAVTPDAKIAFMTPDWTPSLFNGAIQHGDDSHRFRPNSLSLNREDSPNMVVVAAGNRRTFYCLNQYTDWNNNFGDGELWVNDPTGAWAKHTFQGFTIGGLAPGGDISQSNAFQSTRLLISRRCGGSTGAYPQIYTWDFYPDGPGYTPVGIGIPVIVDRFEPGDIDPRTLAPPPAVDSQLITSTYGDNQGRVVRCRSIIISFRKWNSLGTASAGPNNANRINCTVVAEDAYQGGDRQQVQEWHELATASPATGIDDLVRFNFGDQGYSQGFHLELMLRGVAIREITALVDVRGPRV